MIKFGKNIFGNNSNLRAEVTNGKCPLCESPTVFVSIHRNFYRCMNCGGDTEQKVNGVISYIPAGMGENKPSILPQHSNTPEENV
jgi:ribosomal protein S27AE